MDQNSQGVSSDLDILARGQQNGKWKLLIIAIIVALLFVGIVWGLNKALSPTNTATSNNQTDSPSLTDYASPCMSFKYPKDFIKVEENIMREHEISNDQDMYGMSYLVLQRKRGDEEYTIVISCTPNLPGKDFAARLEEAKTSMNNVQEIKVGGIKAFNIMTPVSSDQTQGKGSEYVIAIDGNYILDATLFWTVVEANEKGHPVRAQFADLLSSIKINKIFAEEANNSPNP